MTKRNRIKALAKLIQNRIEYEGKIIWDTSKPNGTPRKLQDVTKLEELGWRYKTSLEEGIKKTYQYFTEKL